MIDNVWRLSSPQLAQERISESAKSALAEFHQGSRVCRMELPFHREALQITAPDESGDVRLAYETAARGHDGTPVREAAIASLLSVRFWADRVAAEAT